MARIVPVIAFLVISYAFVPQVFQGKVLNQGDTSAWKAMAKEANDYNQTHKDEARWTNSMFGGMPTVTINKITTGNYTRSAYKQCSAERAGTGFVPFSGAVGRVSAISGHGHESVACCHRGGKHDLLCIQCPDYCCGAYN